MFPGCSHATRGSILSIARGVYGGAERVSLVAKSHFLGLLLPARYRCLAAFDGPLRPRTLSRIQSGVMGRAGVWVPQVLGACRFFRTLKCSGR